MEAIIYDCTRLLARRSAAIATGIDRVDINYLTFALASGRPVVGVNSVRGYMLLVDEQQVRMLHSYLRAKWIDGNLDAPGLDEVNAVAQRHVQFAGISGSEKHSSRIATIDPGVTAALAKTGAKQCIYVNASHHGLDNCALLSSLKSLLACKFIAFVHDIIPCDYPEYVVAGAPEAHAARLETVSMLADTVIVNSEYTRDRLVNYYQANNLTCPPVHVLLIGAERSFDARATPRGINPLSGEAYFVVLGTIEPRKNHLLLLNIWRRWYEEDRDAPKLVVIGKRGWSNSNILDMLSLPSSSRAKVIELSNLPDTTMAVIIQESLALLFPSFAEGWGMPLVEALALKVPVVCSDLPVFRESGQMCAHYIDPLDGLGWYDTLRAIHSDDAFRQNLVAKAANFVPPSWDQHFGALETLIASCERRPTRLRPERTADQRVLAWKNYSQSTTVRPSLPPRYVRLWRKLRHSPVQYLKDSKIRAFRSLGSLIAQKQANRSK